VSIRSRRAPLAGALVLSVLAPRAARAQLLAGAAVDGATRAPAVGLPLRLLRLTDGAEPVVVDSGVTYERGLFQIMAPGPGVYQLEFGPANHRATRGPVDTLATDARREREYALPITSAGAEVPYQESQVQERAKAPAPARGARSPEVLRQLGDGMYEVVTEFVVDAQGRVETPTVRVVKSTRQELEEPAREALRTMRFQPARIGGIPVRQIARHTATWGIRSERRQVVRRVGPD
jgi:TonB family protein